MKPTTFPEQNTTFAENQPEYLPLPALYDRQGNVLTCWKFSFIERLRVLFFGTLWLNLSTFHNPLQPVFLTTKKTEVLEPEKPIAQYQL